MKIVVFLWFAGVSSLVPLSEAIFARRKKGNENATLEIPYTFETVVENARLASRDFKRNYDVTATMNNSQWQIFTTAIKESLAGYSYPAKLGNLLVNIGEISNVKILDGIVAIRRIDVASKTGKYTIDLSLEVPKVAVTANFASCSRNHLSFGCVTIITIERLSFDMRAISPSGNPRRITNAMIGKFDVGGIKFGVSASGYEGINTTITTSSVPWRGYINSMRSSLKYGGKDGRLVRSFVEEIFL